MPERFTKRRESQDWNLGFDDNELSMQCKADKHVSTRRRGIGGVVQFKEIQPSCKIEEDVVIEKECRSQRCAAGYCKAEDQRTSAPIVSSQCRQKKRDWNVERSCQCCDLAND